MNREPAEYRRIAVFGGIYNNHLALEAVLEDVRRRDVEAVFCLGDMGAFGPHPNRIFPLLKDGSVLAIQGNYDDALATGLDNCQCGYTDPRDNYFARLSYDYTFRKTSPEHKTWLGKLPKQRRVRLGHYRLLMSHGSPRRINEFLWESTSPNCLLEKFCRDFETDVLLCTHTGIKWHRVLDGDRHVVNVGTIGRPENDGHVNVWYTLLTAGDALDVDFIPVHYDYETLASEMKHEGLPVEFIETIRTGWWTTCLEILPAKERGRGKY
ncbi:MAG: metallophosphoesterase family protein [Candidatus Methylomirabilales bacterium]